MSFCGWAPCHAEEALCENTSCKMPSSRMGNFFVMSSSSMASQSTLALATRIGWNPSALMFHFWIRQVTSRARRYVDHELSASWPDKSHFASEWPQLPRDPAGWEPNIENVHHIDGSEPVLKTC